MFAGAFFKTQFLTHYLSKTLNKEKIASTIHDMDLVTFLLLSKSVTPYMNL